MYLLISLLTISSIEFKIIINECEPCYVVLLTLKAPIVAAKLNNVDRTDRAMLIKVNQFLEKHKGICE